ncbi:Transposable element Tcb1 transposase [Anthophora retusa]
MNPIEMLWIDVDKHVKQQNPKNIDELYSIVQEAWNSILASRCARLIESMPRRCAAVIKNKGLHTKY